MAAAAIFKVPNSISVSEKLHCQIRKESENSYDSDIPWKNIWQWQMEIIDLLSLLNTTQIFLDSVVCIILCIQDLQ